MEKYKRFQKEIKNESEIQVFLDELTTEGWNIIFYNEEKNNDGVIIITVVCKKNQNIIL